MFLVVCWLLSFPVLFHLNSLYPWNIWKAYAAEKQLLRQICLETYQLYQGAEQKEIPPAVGVAANAALASTSDGVEKGLSSIVHSGRLYGPEDKWFAVDLQRESRRQQQELS